MSVGWALNSGGVTPSSLAEWFSLRFAAARALLPDAGFDTIIGSDCGETVTVSIEDVVGVATAEPVDFYNGGVVAFAVGDAVVTPSAGRFGLTGAPSHVGDLAAREWYMASLVRLNPPASGEIGDTRADTIALWSDDQNGVGLGMFGSGSGGSTTNWVGHTNIDGSIATIEGPLLDGESPVWHLFEAWNDGAAIHYRIDGVEFDDTLPIAGVPSLPAQLGMRTVRDAIGDQAIGNFDKFCVVMASPTVGETS